MRCYFNIGFCVAIDLTLILQTHHYICNMCMFAAEVVDCGTPGQLVGHGRLSDTETTYLSTQIFICNSGYTSTGDGVITCQANETWTSADVVCTGMFTVFTSLQYEY
jgi:hypothetical protein